MDTIETDYLVVGAGAAGMAFVDTLLTEDELEVVIVDRRHDPGGHWNDAYPFVRLHQASATYGVNSLPLGTDAIDVTGPNAGFYERATGVEVCDYFRRVLHDRFLAMGVRFLGGRDYIGDWSTDHVVVSRLTGGLTRVVVRRRLVDTTYLECSVPATHTPTFTVDAGAKLIPVGRLVDVAEPPSGYTVIGSGKTAMDACAWLLDNGVDPDRIRWIRPRDTWLLDRAAVQPLDLVALTLEAAAERAAAIAEATTTGDVFQRLEAVGQLSRLDAAVEPTMFRGAILSPPEVEHLRQIERVVRRGHVRHIGTTEIALDDGVVPTDAATVHVDCTAYGFRTAPPRAIFENDRITLQSLQGGFTTANAALVAFVEANRDDDRERNRLCPPNPQPNDAADFVRVVAGGLGALAVHTAEPDLAAWSAQSRLSATRGMADRMDDPRVQTALGRLRTNLEPALTSAARLLAANREMVGSGR